MKILVVGGSGHIGRRIVAALQSNSGFEVATGGRFPERYENGVFLCVERPETFHAIGPYDVVINCTDTFKLSPLPLFCHCLKSEKVFVETTADTTAYLQLFDAFEAMPDEERRGIAILGMGIFPGLSNIVAGEAIRAATECENVKLHLSWSVISGAGAGTCEVMVQSLARPIRHARNGSIAEAAPVGPPQSVDVFPGLSHGFELGLPESYLLFKSQGVPNASVIISTRPSGPKFATRMVHWVVRTGIFRPKLIQAVLRILFRLVRVRILAKRSTDLQMVAVAESGGGEKSTTRRMECHDAFQAAAEVLLCGLRLFNQKQRPKPGIYTADQLFTLGEFQTELKNLGIENLFQDAQVTD